MAQAKASTTKSKSSFKWPEEFAAVGWSGLGQQILGSWSKVLQADTGMKCRVAHTPDTVQRFKWTRFGLFQLTAGGTTETSQMIEGDRRYAHRDTGPFQIRAVWAQSKSNSGYFVRGDSPIKDIYGMKPGIRVVDMRGYLASQRILEGFLLWANLDPEKDVVWVPATSSDHKAQLVVEGKADVAFAVPSSPSIFAADKNPYGIRWIDCNSEKDPEGLARFQAVDSLVSFGPMFNGPPSAIGHWGTVGISLYCTREQTDTEFVYQLAKWFDENYEKYRKLHPWNEYMTRDSLMQELQHTFIPCHDGLIAYLKDLKLWTPAHERRQRLNVDLISRYVAANQAAIETADRKNIKVDPKNPEWIELWENYKKDAGIPRIKMFRNLEDDTRGHKMGSKGWVWPSKLSVVSWTGVGVDCSKGWAKYLEEDAQMRIHVAPEFDTVNRYRWLGHLGLFDLSAGAPSETSQMLMADRRYAVRDGGPFQVRAVWSHSKGNAGFFMRGDSKINTPHDIKPGTRIVNMTYVASTRIVEALLAWAQVDKKDIVWVDCNNSVENYKAVIEGRADLGFSFPTSPTMAEAEKNPHGLKWIELNAEKDPEGAKRFKAVDPLVNFGICPEGGVKSAVGVWCTEGINLELTAARTSPELVYHIAKWMDENYERYKSSHPENRFRTRTVLLEGLKHTFVPCHDGLIQYLKELKLWTPAHERRQKQNLELVTRYCEAYQAAIRLADSKGLSVVTDNPEWVKLWEDYKKEKGLPPFKLFSDLNGND
ncbi:MAG: TAXI family TRAP transporter solute-binding subunit [Chloroflexota bacterium]